MKRFLIIDDYTVYCLWDNFIYEVLPKLKSKPQGWKDRCPEIPEGDWTMAHGMHQIATDNAYLTAGIPKPTFEQLPAIFCLTDNGIVGEYKVDNVKAKDFMERNLATA